jgi:inner membrane protein
MAGRREHDAAGVVAGVATALLTARKDAEPYELMLEAIGGGFGGRFGSHVPDVLEPAIHSHHRDVMHSIAVATVLVAEGQKRAMKLVDSLRERADKLRGRHDTSTDLFERFILVLAEAACRMAAGFIAALIPGYVSHLALDAATPRGIPLIAASII